MAKKIMTFDEFVKFLDSDESKQERQEIEKHFSDLKTQKRILTFNEWREIQDRRFLFLTYDLIDTANHPNLYGSINNYLTTLGFSRQINDRQLPNNCFVSFLNPLDQLVLNNIGQTLINFFTNHLPQFRIYLNITSETEYFLHP